MAELEFKVSEDLKQEIEKHKEVDWSAVVGEAIRKELGERAERRIILVALNKMLERSKLTEKDALELGEKVKEGMLKRYKEEGLL
jgi:hypothetical protein